MKKLIVLFVVVLFSLTSISANAQPKKPDFRFGKGGVWKSEVFYNTYRTAGIKEAIYFVVSLYENNKCELDIYCKNDSNEFFVFKHEVGKYLEEPRNIYFWFGEPRARWCEFYPFSAGKNVLDGNVILHVPYTGDFIRIGDAEIKPAVKVN